jgi:hypothetical protein
MYSLPLFFLLCGVVYRSWERCCCVVWCHDEEGREGGGILFIDETSYSLMTLAHRTHHP